MYCKRQGDAQHYGYYGGRIAPWVMAQFSPRVSLEKLP